MSLNKISFCIRNANMGLSNLKNPSRIATSEPWFLVWNYCFWYKPWGGYLLYAWFLHLGILKVPNEIKSWKMGTSTLRNWMWQLELFIWLVLFVKECKRGWLLRVVTRLSLRRMILWLPLQVLHFWIVLLSFNGDSGSFELWFGCSFTRVFWFLGSWDGVNQHFECVVWLLLIQGFWIIGCWGSVVLGWNCRRKLNLFKLSA